MGCWRPEQLIPIFSSAVVQFQHLGPDPDRKITEQKKYWNLGLGVLPGTKEGAAKSIRKGREG
jgi:hypothetical protein